MTQASHPTLINLPPPGSNPETPSETPGTPTSTTTSLSALSTTAIKDGHRGHLPSAFFGRGHQHNPSITSLEAERADRISRLAGLERVSTLLPRSSGNHSASHSPNRNMTSNHNGEEEEGQEYAYQDPNNNTGSHPDDNTEDAASSVSPQTTPTSTTGFPPNFPATQHLTPAYFDSNGQPVAVTKISTVGTASATDSHLGELDDRRTMGGDHDEDIRSTDTNYYREGESVASMSMGGPDPDATDPDLEGLGARSVGGFEDRMSDDGSASLVGFGEGAGSTVSGPIYHRRPVPHAAQLWSLERSNSGLSDARRADREASMGGDTPASASAAQERREARMVDGVAADLGSPAGNSDQDVFVDTTFRGPVPVGRAPGQRFSHQRFDSGDARTASSLGSPGRDSEPMAKME
ncbi:hypothetical protein ESCO_002750 [Escovopsis weberi]|uniref:Uncharacterized protein n=1 Tax=Escovopsis weberi TaxID=150374 RepID=A0A0M8N0Z8_ESCWE|nr:hypothetical protein ESCO_002750 [Escovopsis weberi]